MLAKAFAHEHLEIVEPDIPAGIAACVAAGATEVVVHPYFLGPGRHTTSDIPEIVECYTVSGDRDFLLRVVVEDVSAYERLLKKTLVHLPQVANMSSTFALRQVKYTTELPVQLLP